jgi:hypothetical protein
MEFLEPQRFDYLSGSISILFCKLELQLIKRLYRDLMAVFSMYFTGLFFPRSFLDKEYIVYLEEDLLGNINRKGYSAGDNEQSMVGGCGEEEVRLFGQLIHTLIKQRTEKLMMYKFQILESWLFYRVYSCVR